jgi:hypothetical protein
MKGTWQGSGTWQTSGGGSGAALRAMLYAVLGAVAFAAACWLLARLWWVLGGLLLAVAAVAAVIRWLIRAQEHREAMHAARCPFGLAQRAPAAVTAQAMPAALTSGDLHLHFHDADAERAAAIIRHALPGTAGDADTERN